MPILLLIAVGIIGSVGVTLLLDTWIRRDGRADLVERILPCQPSSADEAENCLPPL
jgi:hypothetical protein